MSYVVLLCIMLLIIHSYLQVVFGNEDLCVQLDACILIKFDSYSEYQFQTIVKFFWLDCLLTVLLVYICVKEQINFYLNGPQKKKN